MAGPMTAYRCDVTSVLAAQMPCRPTNFCLLLLSAVPYFGWLYAAVGKITNAGGEDREVYAGGYLGLDLAQQVNMFFGQYKQSS